MSDEMFDDSIRRKLNQHESLVPADAWDHIRPRKRKRRAILAWWLLPALLIGFGVYWQTGDHSSFLSKQDTISDTRSTKVPGSTDQSSNAVITTETSSEETLSTNDAVMQDAGQKKENAAVQRDQKMPASTSENKNKSTSESSTVPLQNDKFNQQNSVKKNTVINKTDNASGVEMEVIANSSVVSTSQDVEVKSRINNDRTNELMPLATPENIKTDDTGEVIIAAAGKVIAPAVNVTIDSIAMPTTTHTADSVISAATTSDQTALQKIKLPARKLWLNAAVTGISVLPQQKEIAALNRRTVTGNEFKDFNATSVDVGYEPSISYTLSLQKELNKKWGIGVGFQYQLLKQRLFLEGIETQGTVNFIDVLVNTGGQNMLVRDSNITSTTGTRTIQAINSYRRIGIPVYVEYKIMQWPKWYIGLQAGAVINIAQNYHNSIPGDFTRPSIDSNTSSANWGIDLFVQAKLARRLHQRWEAFIAPSFFLNRSAPRQQNWIQTYLNQAGLSLGLSYSLKK